MNMDYMRKYFSLNGRRAVVTGAGSGIGQAAAVALAGFGAEEVILIGRNAAKLKKTEDEISKTGGTSRTFVVDISKRDEVEAFFAQYRKERGRLDILVANAGINVRIDALETTDEDFDLVVNNNLKGNWRCVKHAGEIMREQRGGNIVLVTSVNALAPSPVQAVYSAAKAALNNMMEGLAVVLAPYNVRVNSIAPGTILTDLNRHIFGVESTRKFKETEIPLGFVADPPDIGNVIACMTTDAFRFMTGSTVLVDGGEILRVPHSLPGNPR